MHCCFYWETYNNSQIKCFVLDQVNYISHFSRDIQFLPRTVALLDLDFMTLFCNLFGLHFETPKKVFIGMKMKMYSI